VLAIARVGSSRPQVERADLSCKLSGRYGDTWQIPGVELSRFNKSDTPNDSDLFALAELWIGGEAETRALCGFLVDEDPFVRLVAAQRLGASGEMSASGSDLREALVGATRTAHPKQVPKDRTVHFQLGAREVDLDARIHAAAAAALVAFDLPADQRAEFLPLLRTGDDVEAIARGLRRWADARSLQALTDALGDERPAVAVAAAEAIGSLGKAGAPAAPALRRAAADARVAVAAAARAALRSVE